MYAHSDPLKVMSHKILVTSPESKFLFSFGLGLGLGLVNFYTIHLCLQKQTDTPTIF